MKALENAVRKVAKAEGDKVDFSKAGAGGGAPLQDMLPVLSKDFNIHSRPITIDQIPDALKEGPVMAAVNDGKPHGELIIGMDKDGAGESYRVYNPRNDRPQATTIDASQIIRDRNGTAELYALRPYRLGEAHPKSDSELSRE